ncbi:hypothetical protein M011DRAFT_172326 [Sporormia fimetaria CBS 119925]|uniref:Uncharacterized protein n=1 Tax=Sporormia fimetaria CBS 119925 TaxID=1340428 RepID=A0A6A6V3H8_9PLEO|nr:hypothetical protein M011DRAFT_172326 [Sporormia fimetaria CBS 119925]
MHKRYASALTYTWHRRTYIHRATKPQSHTAGYGERISDGRSWRGIEAEDWNHERVGRCRKYVRLPHMSFRWKGVVGKPRECGSAFNDPWGVNALRRRQNIAMPLPYHCPTLKVPLLAGQPPEAPTCISTLRTQDLQATKIIRVPCVASASRHAVPNSGERATKLHSAASQGKIENSGNREREQADADAVGE